MRKILVFLFVITLIFSFAGMSHALNYAVIYSGGYNAYNNHDRYYEETLRMWELATGTMGYDASNVYVLFADGTDDGIDRSSGVNSDWSDIVNAGGNILSATATDLEQTLSQLGDEMTTDDDFYFWSFDHGSGSSAVDDTSLIAWDSGFIKDEQFASWVNPYKVNSEAYIFGQCFAGGMADDLNITEDDGETRFAAWAADWYEYSWGQGWMDAWADGIEAGYTNTWDLGEYAKNNDKYAIDGREHPGWIGDNFSIAATPEPGTILLFGIGLTGLITVRRRLKRD